ncbi:hypothetical protein JGH11_17100 [Dysgonomonas sp. Marseille-P4677]|uniref:DUF3868 domain-containing protein n=1 Tax=Dysgonomonas sp. Marseille-P4677 TaxID=2364790 RepID=UPI001913F3B6|nr:DUF3868 domain-containing protein [Dysgonomonas sp. Marseille-P4677]MBK5722594.1 hypothetical protein [Dysgonomonas sp. Marseille-P4677]
MYQVEFIPVSLEKKDSRFYIEADMSILCRHVGKDEFFMCTPILSNNEYRLELPSVLIAGYRRYRSQKFAIYGFGRNLLSGYKFYKMLKAVNSSWINYPYRVCMDYEEWMAEAKVACLISNKS